jgi:molybdenum cofactor cytidylyltransferase
MSLTLPRALRVNSASSIAFIGAGGKTTAMFQLARTLSEGQGASPVIVAATSHLGAWQIELADRHIVTEIPAPLEELEHGLKGVILITGELEGERTRPINNDLLSWLHSFCGYHSIPLLIEADGAREKPLKAWAEHEPPVPRFAEIVVQVVGLTGVNKPLSPENVHRAEQFSRLSGQRLGELVTPEALAGVLTHVEGGLRNTPSNARRIALLNQADTTELQSLAQRLVQFLLPSYDAVVTASLRQEKVFAVYEPIAGIILAAGASTRFGQPKQLLDWKGQPFVRAVAMTALQAGLSPVIVVTGASAKEVEPAVQGLDVSVIRNEEWAAGQGGSIVAGIRTLLDSPVSLHAERTGAAGVGGAVFLLADQPQVTTSIIRALVERHAQGLYPIVAPLVVDRRANPVLCDRTTFRDLSALQGDVGGRAIFHRHAVEYLPWHDDRLLLDVDTPEMYQRLISDETL